MFAFQSTSLAAGAGASIEKIDGITPVILRKLDAVFQNPTAKIPVVGLDNKTREMTKNDSGAQANMVLQGLSNSNPYKLLQTSIGVTNDAEIVKLVQSKIPWFNEKSLQELKAGGNEAFKTIFEKMCTSALNEDLLRAAIITSNVGNNGENLNSLGLQDTVAKMASTYILTAYALSTADRAASRDEFSINAAGGLGDFVSFDIDPKKQDILCADVKLAYFSAACLSFDLDAAAFRGTPMTAMQAVIKNGTRGAEQRANSLMGKGFCEQLEFHHFNQHQESRFIQWQARQEDIHIINRQQPSVA